MAPFRSVLFIRAVTAAAVCESPTDHSCHLPEENGGLQVDKLEESVKKEKPEGVSVKKEKPEEAFVEERLAKLEATSVEREPSITFHKKTSELRGGLSGNKQLIKKQKADEPPLHNINLQVEHGAHFIFEGEVEKSLNITAAQGLGGFVLKSAPTKEIVATTMAHGQVGIFVNNPNNTTIKQVILATYGGNIDFSLRKGGVDTMWIDHGAGIIYTEEAGWCRSDYVVGANLERPNIKITLLDKEDHSVVKVNSLRGNVSSSGKIEIKGVCPMRNEIDIANTCVGKGQMEIVCTGEKQEGSEWEDKVVQCDGIIPELSAALCFEKIADIAYPERGREVHLIFRNSNAQKKIGSLWNTIGKSTTLEYRHPIFLDGQHPILLGVIIFLIGMGAVLLLAGVHALCRRQRRSRDEARRMSFESRLYGRVDRYITEYPDYTGEEAIPVIVIDPQGVPA